MTPAAQTDEEAHNNPTRSNTMTHQAPAVADTTTHAAIPQPVLWLAIAVFTATTALTLYGAHGRYEIPMVLTGIVVSVVGVYGFLLPRKLAQPSAGGTALILSGVGAVLLVPTFWSGQSLILGAAGALLGYAGRKAPSGAGKSITAAVVGLLVCIGYFAVYLLDALLPAGTA
jgi:hypothetical protein